MVVVFITDVDCKFVYTNDSDFENYLKSAERFMRVASGLSEERTLSLEGIPGW